MKLFFDIGNTRIKAAVLRGNGLETLTSCETAVKQFPDNWNNLEKPNAIYLSSVANHAVSDAIGDWAKTKWSMETQNVAVVQGAGGMQTAYKNPAQLGVDRWLAAIGAYHEAGRKSVCVIDAGTALTVDIVDEQGLHLGGMIAPGLNLMIESLTRNTEHLSLEKISVPDIFAVTTEDAISLGCADYLAGMIEKLKERLTRAGLQNATWYVTGGQGETVAELSDVTMHIVPDLVIRGLAIVAEENL